LLSRLLGKTVRSSRKKQAVNFGPHRNCCNRLPFKIKKPTVDNRKTEDLTPDQIQALSKAMDAGYNQEDAAFMRPALFTGMRRGEVFKLK